MLSLRNQFFTFDVAAFLQFRTTTTTRLSWSHSQHTRTCGCLGLGGSCFWWGFALRNILFLPLFFFARYLFYCHFNFIKIIHEHSRVRYSFVHLFWILELETKITKKTEKSKKTEHFANFAFLFMEMLKVNFEKKNVLITQNFIQCDERGGKKYV